MPSKQHVFLKRRKYNQWVANETLEDFALRYTPQHARKWSAARIANTALGIVSFLALEAIGGAITLQFGFTNSFWAIITSCTLIFLCGLPICYYAAKFGLDIDLLTRGAGFGYIGSTISSLIYASFTFIFFALEAAIMSMALHLLFDISLSWAYVISAIVVIPLVTHGITRISRFQLWTQPIWVILQIAPLIYILIYHSDALSVWTTFSGSKETNGDSFNLFLFGAAVAVIFPLMAQNAEQVDYLRFLPDKNKGAKKWWWSLILAGPGWSIVGLIKLFIGSFLAVLALQHGVVESLADDPAHMYQVAFSYISHNPTFALILATVFVIISQLKINVTNAYAGSIAWSNFFSRLTHDHPGRIVWLFFNVIIALLLMELGLYHTFENILITYSALVLAWIGALVADLTINMALGLRPKHIEFKRGHLYDINPVGVLSMIIASTLGITGQLGFFGETFKALSPFIALFTPFILAPAIAYYTKGRYYSARDSETSHGEISQCIVCENEFEKEDITSCPAYQGNICSLCCALESSCQDQCRPQATIQKQTLHFFSKILPDTIIAKSQSVVIHFISIWFVTAGLIAVLFSLILTAVSSNNAEFVELTSQVLWQAYFLLMIVTGVLIWLYVLAENSRKKAYQESLNQNQMLGKEIKAHEVTAEELQSAKEAAVTANHAKSRYLSGVSHELRTPLNSIYGYSQLLAQNTYLESKDHKAAEAIRRNSEYLSDVIEGLLEISKIEARRLDLHRDSVNLITVLDQLVEVFQAQAAEKNIEFIYEKSTRLPQYVAVDEKRFRQILMNLLSNAVKYTFKGSVSFSVSYRNEVATFSVSDTGVGISEADQTRIFEPFERIRNEKTQLVSGTGLGLSISQLLCSMMGGDISVKSEPNKGSCFTFLIMLPAIHGQENIDAADGRSTSKPIAGYEGNIKNVMIVDDEPYHRNFISEFLTPLGFNMIEAINAEDAINKSKNVEIDLFILDVSLPGMDGWELAANLRSKKQNAKIIMLSGNAIENHRIEITSQLHDYYLIKPVRLEVLLEKMGLLLDLQWKYIAQKPVNSTPQPAFTYQISDFSELVSAAQIGYLDGVHNEIQKIGQKYGQTPLVDALKQKADNCDFNGIVQLINDNCKQ